MLVEIRGINFFNKGAELMLYSIIAKIRESMPQTKLVMAPPGGYSSYSKRARLGLYQKTWLHYGIQWGYLGKLIPKKIRQMYGMILDSEIDVVLDSSGFLYSDQWGVKNTREAAGCIKKWKKNGTKVIFLPQAFGPFSNPKIRKSIKIIIDNADRIFARDKVSYGHLAELAGEHENIMIAPDFTNLIEGDMPEDFDAQANRFCIIPNYRMIDKTRADESKNYIPFLVYCAKYLNDKGAKPFILIHEGDKDLCLGQKIVQGTGREIKIIQENNALRIKGIIGACEGLISSRFHGLISALSQGIPALATGWSHKYEELLKDYNFPEGIITVNSSQEKIKNQIDLLTSEKERRSIKQKILVASQIQKQKAIRMWDEIFTLLKLWH